MSEQVLGVLPSGVKDLIEVSEGEDAWVFRKKRSLTDAEYKAIIAVVEDYGGKYIRGEQVFAIPKEAFVPKINPPQTKNLQPVPDYSQKTTEDKIAIGNSEEDNPAFLEEIPVGYVVPGMFQPRQSMDEERLAELAESVRSEGVLQPILVRPMLGDKYEVISGFRRVEASKRAGLTMIPALVKEMSDQEAKIKAFVSNEEHEDLTPYEKASYLKILMKDYSNQKSLAEALGKSESWISRNLAILKLEDEIANGNSENTLSHLNQHQIRALKRIPEEQRKEFVENRLNDPEDLPSAREIEDYAESLTQAVEDAGAEVAETVEPGIKEESVGEALKTGSQIREETEPEDGEIPAIPTRFIFETDVRLHCDFAEDEFYLEVSKPSMKAFRSLMERRGWLKLTVGEWLSKMSILNQIRWRDE